MSFRSLLSALLLVSYVSAQSPSSSALEPLASKHYTWPDVPYQVTGDQGGIRGPQFGINLCNSTTEGSNSTCQTAFLNDITDFCMWSSPKNDDTIGVSEAYEVAWCSKSGHGTRIIPSGAITGAQWLYAKNYVQVVGYIDQSMVNLDPTDEGGELDPHGADGQGNPLGGIVFTNGFGMNAAAFDSALNGKSLDQTQNFTQVIEWIDFIGGGVFCLKMCNPDDPNAPNLCQHIYDEVGCTYNALADYQSINNTFSVCDSDDMTPPGIYTSAGQTLTWFQPTVGPVGTPPYTPVIPSSSNCHTYSSAQLFAAAPTGTSSSGSNAGSGSGSGSGSGASGSEGGSGASQTGTSNAAVALGFEGRGKEMLALAAGAILGAAFTLL